MGWGCVTVRATSHRATVLRRCGPEVLKHAGDVVLRAGVPEAAVEPELVLYEWTANGGVHVPQLLDAVDAKEPNLLQVGRQVVALQRVVGEAAEEVALEGVAAFLGNGVAQHAARAPFRRKRARRHRQLLDDAGVLHERGVVATTRVVHVVVRHAVHDERHLVATATVDRERLIAFATRATHVLVGQRNDDARHEDAQTLEAASRRQGIDHRTRERLALLGALGVDERALAGNRDGLFESADSQISVDGGGETTGQFDTFALHRAESDQREGDGIGARSQIDDAVTAIGVRDDRADFLDQGRTGCLDRYARHDTA